MIEAARFFSNLGENVTLLLALALAHGRLTAHLHTMHPWLRGAVNGLLFSVAAIVGIFLPFELSQGIAFDSRPIIVMAAAIFGGPVSGTVAVTVVGLWSLYLGGPGVVPSLGGVATAALIGIVAGFGAVEGRLRRLVPGVLVALSSLAWTFALPAELAPRVLHEMALPLLVYYPLGFLVLTVVVSYEQHQRARERALEQSERRFRAIFNSTFQLIGLLAPDGRVLEANRTALDLVGLDDRDVVGRRLWETPWCPADATARRRLMAAIRHAASGHVVRFEAAIRRPGRGRVAYVDFSLQPIRDEFGHVIMLLPEGRDITERKATEARLLQAEEHLRQAQKMEAVGQLTGGIAHDFNNLLTVVGGNLELLKRRDLGIDERRLIDAAMRGVARGATLTQQLLAFSRKQRLTPEPVAVNQTVLDAAAMLQRLLGESVDVRTELAADLRVGYFDPHQMETALLNLAINARDAMPSGGLLTIRTENAEMPGEGGSGEAEFVLLTVSDTGIGMEPEILRRAIEPFFTTKEVGRGSGLGLSMVYGFVKQSGGHIDIASVPGKGTVVRIYLPIAQGAVTKPPIAVLAGRSAPPGEWRGKEVILVVEDQSDVRALAATLLQDMGYVVHQAVDGVAALDIVQSGERIDLIFTDVVMPRMGGVALADQARALRPGIRILFTSGHAGGHDGSLAQTGNEDFIGKPFQRDDLAGKVRCLLDQPVRAMVSAKSATG
jgi:PAS domain S-box-containing protein